MRYIAYFIFILILISCNKNHNSISTLITPSGLQTKNNEIKIIDIGVPIKINNIDAIELADDHKFGFTTELSVKPNTYYCIQVKVASKHFTVNLASESEWNGWIGTHNPTILDDKDNWYSLQLLLKTPDTITHGKFKIYAYNWANDTAYIDSLQIKEYHEFPYTDSLPNYIFNTLTYDILNELAFYTKNTTEKNFQDLLDEPFLKIVYEKHFISESLYKRELHRRIEKEGILSIFNKIKQVAEVLKNPSVNTKPRETFETKLTAYSEKIIYNQGEHAIIKLQNTASLKTIQLLLPIRNYKFQKLKDYPISNKNSLTIDTKDLEPNTYCLQLKDANTTFNVPLIINSIKKSKTIVLAPITTWHAYNHYGGKCFYVNTKDDSCVYFLSTQRPLVSCLFDSVLVGHDLFIFQNIYAFFYDNYQCNVYPDYYLESHPELFVDAHTIIFAQHCEYFSTKMFEQLSIFSKTKNIISLGGNQAYYKIQFSNNYQTVECRKDGTFLNNTLVPAGNWRTQFSNEAKYWGNAYTDAGYETYCSYKVKTPEHWLFKNCSVKKDDEFGKYGIDNRGTSGDEMDKANTNTPKNAVILAKGTNPNDGGGEIMIIENKNNAILSFGSIASGSGINKDYVITQMIKNFMQKYSFLSP